MGFFLAKYGTQTTIYFAMVKRAVVDLAVTADWTPASGDVHIIKDGVAAWATNLPAIVSGSFADWSLVLTSAELQATETDIVIVDAATKAVEDQFLTVYTFGGISGRVMVDWSDNVRMGLTALPNAVPGAAGGLLLSGGYTNVIDKTGFSLVAGQTVTSGGYVNVVDKTGFALTTPPIASGAAVTLVADQAVNVTKWNGHPVVTDVVSGSPVVTLGAAQAAYAPLVSGGYVTLISGQVVIVGANNDKTAYQLLSGQSVVVGDKTGFSLVVTPLTSGGQVNLVSGQIVIVGDKTGFSLATAPLTSGGMVNLVSGQIVSVGDKTGFGLASGQVVIVSVNNDKINYLLASGQIVPASDVNVIQWGGANIITPTISGCPTVVLASGQPNFTPAIPGDEMSLLSGQIVIPDKTGYELASGQQVITTTNLDKVNYALAGPVALLSGQHVITDNSIASGSMFDANVVQWDGADISPPVVSGQPVVTLGAAQAAYTPLVSGGAVTLVSGQVEIAIESFQVSLLGNAEVSSP